MKLMSSIKQERHPRHPTSTLKAAILDEINNKRKPRKEEDIELNIVKY